MTDKWYSESILWAYESKLVNGVDEDTFAPDAQITREQFATMLYRYANYIGVDTTPRADLSVYRDAWDVSAYAKDAVSWAVAKGIIKGVSEDTLLPRGYCTRSQAAELIRLASEKMYDCAAPKLYIRGSDTTENTPLAINYAMKYAVLPIEELLTAFGIKTEVKSEDILIAGKYAIDIKTGNINLANTVNENGRVNEALYTAEDLKIGRYIRFCQMVDGKLLLDSTSARKLLSNICGASLSVNFNTGRILVNGYSIVSRESAPAGEKVDYSVYSTVLPDHGTFCNSIKIPVENGSEWDSEHTLYYNSISSVAELNDFVTDVRSDNETVKEYINNYMAFLNDSDDNYFSEKTLLIFMNIYKYDVSSEWNVEKITKDGNELCITTSTLVWRSDPSQAILPTAFHDDYTIIEINNKYLEDIDTVSVYMKASN